MKEVLFYADMEKKLLQYYFNTPNRLLLCPLERADFGQYGFVYDSLKSHATEYGDIDINVFAVKNINAFIALDLHEYSVPISESAEVVMIEKLRENRLRTVAKNIKTLEDINDLDELRKPIQIESKVSLKEGVTKYWEEFAEVADRREKTGTVGLPVGLSVFNEYPLIPNTLLVLGARTSIGKTAVALNMAYNLAENGGKVLYMTAEMDYNSVLSRMYALATGHSVSGFIHAYQDKFISDAYDKVKVLKGDVELKYCGGWDWNKVKSYILAQEGYDMIVFDHLHYLPVPPKGSEVTFLTEVINDAKMIAGHQRNTFVMLAQCNRSVGDNSQEPEVYHLRGSGGIEQGADMVVMMHRQERAEPQGHLTVAKNRSGKAGDRYEIHLNLKTLRIT